MIHIDEEEIIDLVVGLLLLLFASLMLGYCMARIARADDGDDDDDEDNNIANDGTKGSVCCGLLRKNSSAPPREFTSLNELLVEVDDNDEKGKVVVTKVSTQSSSSVSDSDTNERRSDPCYTLDSIFPNILKEDKVSNNGSLEEPLLRDS